MGQPQQYRYVNQRSGPIILPAKQGGLVTVSPGQWLTDPWFGRFVGKGGLSKVPASALKGTRSTSLGPRPTRPVTPASAPKVELELQQPQTMLDQVEPPTEEETPDWRRQTGIYRCKHCDVFRTGSRTVMEAHLLSKHKVVVAGASDSPTVAPAVPPVGTPAAPPKSEEKPPAATTDDKKTEPVEEHWCPECKRRFKSADGLVRHRRAIHRVEIPA